MRERTKNIWSTILAIFSCMALFSRYELYQGDGSNILGIVLHRFYNSFNISAMPALVVAVALFFLYKFVFENSDKFMVGTYILSFVMAFLYVLSTFYSKYDSSKYLYANSYQIIMTVICVVGLSGVIYASLVLLLATIEKERINPYKYSENFFERHFFIFSVTIILASWLVWIIGNYPGTGNSDSNDQLMFFLGQKTWSTWHPPLSSVIMGVCFSLGKLIIDANFGFFLYCVFQSISGAVIFSYGFKKLKDYGVAIGYCAAGVLFFALLPVWGSFAQYFEKDFLYTQLIVLQLIFSADILIKQECDKKDYIRLTIASLLAVFLRNNGIYAVIPGLLLLAIMLKKISRGYVLGCLAVVLILYEGMVRLAFPAMGMEKSSASETFGIMFQQTAKYVIDHPEDVTLEEKEVLEANFQSLDKFKKYNPRIFDCVKIYYNNKDFDGYVKVWKAQLMRHPGSYIEATLNGAYGYMAPVDTDMGGWLQEEYDEYQTEQGIYHPTTGWVGYLIWFWNIAQVIPVLNILCMPGFYTWVILILTWLLIKKKRAVGLVLLVPSFMNVLVCVASPLANAMRYTIPVAAATPFLIGIVIYYLKKYRTVS